MRFFQHTVAEYVCAKRCGNHRSSPSPNFSAFHLAAAAIAALALSLLFSRYPWFMPWYDSFGIFGCELLLIYLASFLANLLFIPFTFRDTSICTACGAPMILVGRHFDPKGSRLPHWTDLAIFAVFVALNIALWIVELGERG